MHVAVLAGGRSPEHEVSLASAAQVLHHLDRERFTVVPVYLDQHGGWWPEPAPLAGGAVWQAKALPQANVRSSPGQCLDALLTRGVEVVFPVLHGPFGEDGTVQGMLQLYDLPCVGSGCAASAVAMDKLRTREVFAAAGLPLAKAYVPSAPLAGADAAVEFAAMARAVGTPAFAKVDASGSSVGVRPIRTEAELRTFLGEFQRPFRRWFAEAAVLGEEITVAVLGNTGERLEPLPPVGIYPRGGGHFDYKAKYEHGATEEVVPPRGLTAAQIRLVQTLAVRCHEALVCDGMSRTDMIFTANGPIVLETNTIPGLTKTSLLPQAAAAAGISFAALLSRLIDAAVQRGDRRSRAAATDQRGLPRNDAPRTAEA
jgi:D-alanine-D-alanine ligase